MRKTIKADKEERVISDFFVSDNALIEYRQKDDNTVHAVVRYVEHSSIKEVTLYIADPKKDIYIQLMFQMMQLPLQYSNMKEILRD